MSFLDLRDTVPSLDLSFPWLNWAEFRILAVAREGADIMISVSADTMAAKLAYMWLDLAYFEGPWQLKKSSSQFSSYFLVWITWEGI